MVDLRVVVSAIDQALHKMGRPMHEVTQDVGLEWLSVHHFKIVVKQGKQLTSG